jgi:hypothetical protein
MLRIIKRIIVPIAIAITLISVSTANAQQSVPTPAAPIPAQIAAGKKVFISNGGNDGTTLATLKRAGDPDAPYNHLYAAMQSWGRYELVTSPADADMVFEIRFTAPMTDCGKVTSYAPQLELAILDAKTHFRLWTITGPVEGAIRKATWDKNFSDGVATLMDTLKKLTTSP